MVYTGFWAGHSSNPASGTYSRDRDAGEAQKEHHAAVETRPRRLLKDIDDVLIEVDGWLTVNLGGVFLVRERRKSKLQNVHDHENQQRRPDTNILFDKYRQDCWDHPCSTGRIPIASRERFFSHSPIPGDCVQ